MQQKIKINYNSTMMSYKDLTFDGEAISFNSTFISKGNYQILATEYYIGWTSTQMVSVIESIILRLK
jgi:hypothetical protein